MPSATPNNFPVRRISPAAAQTAARIQLLLAIAFSLFSALAHAASPRVIVLGIDGMDLALTRTLLDQGKLPNLANLAKDGSFLPLQTSMPPLSPVAWSNFITGSNPGNHAVFDFLRRDPAAVGPNLLPDDAVSAILPPTAAEWPLPFTPYAWPPQSRMTLLRKGTPLWQILESRRIPATIYKIPANFPVSPSNSHILAGMGTPDIEGSYGLFSYLSSQPDDWAKTLTGGRILRATVENGIVRILTHSGQTAPFLHGPINPFLSAKQPSETRRANVPFDLYLDPDEKTAAISLQGRDIVLNQGQWSTWVPVQFDLLPNIKSIHGLVRFYLQQASPSLRLFISPVNLAPGTPGLASSRLDALLYDALGPYATKGMPQETKALMQGLFSTDEYLAQADLVLNEELQALNFLLPRQSHGLLFFYISALDLSSHVLWQHHDPQHPAYDKNQSPRHANRIADLYIRLDALVGNVRAQLRPTDVLYVISDHGFAPVYRQFNLATFLANEGYLVFTPSALNKTSRSFADVDWSKTRAYALGFQSLYINLQHREATGIVTPMQYAPLVDEIRAKLLALNNPSIFKNVYRPAEIYTGPFVNDAPDLILGYAPPFGPSDDAVLGTWTPNLLSHDPRSFAANHAADFSAVPGVLFSTRKLPRHAPRLEDVTITILKDFGLPPDPQMTGKPLY